MSNIVASAVQPANSTAAVYHLRPHRILVAWRSNNWRESTLERLEQLIRIPKGWDGYDGLPTTLENATFALALLDASCPDDAPIPQIVPGNSGDLQIEWHIEGTSIELHVIAPNRVRAWRHSGNSEEAHDLTLDFAIVGSWVEELMEPELAITAASA